MKVPGRAAARDGENDGESEDDYDREDEDDRDREDEDDRDREREDDRDRETARTTSPSKVLDFGIAKQLDAGEISRITGATLPADPGTTRTQQGALIGTLPYMSPEQLRCEHVDARSDLWAVGIILYELCTGARPFEPFTTTSLADVANLDSPMPSVSERRPDVGALGAVVDRCLKKRKAERFGAVEELCAALEPLLPDRKALGGGEGENPFAGLAAFQEADAGRFFGRDREVAAVVGRLRNQPLLAVAGPSGAGKSSFVRAGVIPRPKPNCTASCSSSTSSSARHLGGDHRRGNLTTSSPLTSLRGLSSRSGPKTVATLWTAHAGVDDRSLR